MASRNKYPGYVKLPGKELYKQDIRLDFNAKLRDEDNISKNTGFSLRMFTEPKPEEFGKQMQPEISVNLTVEQWLDLIDAMKEHLTQAEETRKNLEDLSDDN